MEDKTKDRTPLRDKHEQFCREYVIELNKVKSYQIVYPDSSYNAARSSACDLLTNPNIQARVKELQANLSLATGVTAIRNINELAKIAYTNVVDMVDSHGNLIDYEDLTEGQKGAISEVYVETVLIQGGDDDSDMTIKKRKVRLHDKIKAILSLNQMLGFNAPEKIENTMVIKQVTGIEVK